MTDIERMLDPKTITMSRFINFYTKKDGNIFIQKFLKGLQNVTEIQLYERLYELGKEMEKIGKYEYFDKALTEVVDEEYLLDTFKIIDSYPEIDGLIIDKMLYVEIRLLSNREDYDMYDIIRAIDEHGVEMVEKAIDLMIERDEYNVDADIVERIPFEEISRLKGKEVYIEIESKDNVIKRLFSILEDEFLTVETEFKAENHIVFKVR